MKWFVLVFAVASLSAAEVKWEENRPAKLEAEVSFSLKQQFPDFALNTQGVQTIDANLTLLNPNQIQFTLKRLKVDLKNNDESVTFDTKEPKSSFYLSQAATIIDRPLQLTLSKNFTLQEDSVELLGLINQLPVLREFCPKAVLAEMIDPLFFLRGKKVKVGQKFTYGPLNYEIVAITDTQVQAVIKGSLESKAIPFEAGTLTTSGTIHGEASWNKTNALDFQQTLDYTMTGLFTQGKKEWVLQSASNVKITSHTPG